MWARSAESVSPETGLKWPSHSPKSEVRGWIPEGYTWTCDSGQLCFKDHCVCVHICSSHPTSTLYQQWKQKQTKQMKSTSPGLTGGSWAEGAAMHQTLWSPGMKQRDGCFLRMEDFGVREWARSHLWAIIEKSTGRKIRHHSKEWNRRRTLLIRYELEELLEQEGKDRYHISEAKYSFHHRTPC